MAFLGTNDFKEAQEFGGLMLSRSHGRGNAMEARWRQLGTLSWAMAVSSVRVSGIGRCESDCKEEAFLRGSKGAAKFLAAVT